MITSRCDAGSASTALRVKVRLSVSSECASGSSPEWRFAALGSNASASSRITSGRAASRATATRDRDPSEPGTERPIAPVRRQCTIGPEEGVLGRILRLDRIANDPLADADHGLGLPVHERPERLLIAGDDGIDKLTVL